MELFILVLIIIISLALIVKGGDMFITSSVWMANRTKMPQLLIGATVVSIGTTLPEIAVSVMSAAKGDYSLAISNAIGSMLCNISIIIGIALLLTDCVIDRKRFRSKLIIILISIIFLALSLLDGKLSYIESLTMLVIFIIYFAGSISEARSEMLAKPKVTMDYLRSKTQSPALMMSYFVIGLILILSGAYFLVTNIEMLAVKYVGVSTTIAGVTVIALASALPELITVITAVRKKAAAISLGNVIGANIINSTLLTGVVGLMSGGKDTVQGDTVSQMLGGTVSTALLGAFACIITLLLLVVPLFLRGRTYRRQGIALVSVYVCYILLILMIVTGIMAW